MRLTSETCVASEGHFFLAQDVVLAEIFEDSV